MGKDENNLTDILIDEIPEPVLSDEDEIFMTTSEKTQKKEEMRQKAVDELLEKRGLTRQDVGTNGSGNASLLDSEPVHNFGADELAVEEAETAPIVENEPSFVDLAGEPPISSLPQAMANNTAEPSFLDLVNEPESTEKPIPTTSFETPQQIAKRAVDELVPSAGEIFHAGDFAALGFVLPDDIRRVIIKAQLPRPTVFNMLEQYCEAFEITDKEWGKVRAIVVKNEDDEASMLAAKEKQKLYQSARITLEDRRKAMVKDAKAYTGMIDNVARPLRRELEALEAAAREKAEYKLNLERQRKQAIADDRANKLRAFNAPIPPDLSNMSDETWKMAYNGAVSAYNEEEARKKRAADEQQKENERLINEKNEADAKAAIEKQRADDAEKLLADQRKEEERAQEFKKAEDLRLANLPDKEKFLHLAAQFEAMPMPETVSEAGLALRARIEKAVGLIVAECRSFE